MAGSLLRSLLLFEAFEGVAADLKDERDVTRLLKEWAAPQLPGGRRTEIQEIIRWPTVWEHYSELAELKAQRLYRINGMAGPTDSEQLETFAKDVRAIAEGTESLLYGQTAIMASLERQEAAARRLLDNHESASATTKNGCLTAVRSHLGPLFDCLADDTRRFLEAAEWVYSEAPAGLDRSLVIVGFTKAFETELWHALQPLRDSLQQSADTRPYKKKPVTEFSLGELARLLVDNRSVLRPLLDKLGLAYSAILEAIRTVNQEMRAKHREARGEAEAKSFRALFLRTPSVLAYVCPPKKTE